MRHTRWNAGGSRDIATVFAFPMAAAVSLFLAFASSPAAAQETREFPTQTGTVLVETLASGLEHPWAVEAMPDGALIVTERPGRLRILRDGKLSAAIKGVPTAAAHGQGGLLDVALDRQFATNRTLYLTLSVRGDGGYGTVLVRAALSQDEQSLTEVKEIFRMNKFTRKGQHFGSRIAIDRTAACSSASAIAAKANAPRTPATMPARSSTSTPTAAFPPPIPIAAAPAGWRKSGP